MATPNTRNAAAWKPDVAGGVYVAPLGTTLPTDASTALDSAITDGALGYVSDAGLVPTRDTSVEKPKAWGGDVIAQLLTDESRSFNFTLLELFSQAVQEFIHGAANVAYVAAGSGTNSTFAIQDRGGKPEQCVMVFEMRSGDRRRRIVVPLADPVVDSEEPAVDGELSAYGVTVEALKDSNGVRVYEYLEGDDALA